MPILSKGSRILEEITNAAVELQEGVVLSIDPSIGSHSSMPGFAVYRSRLLYESGVIPINPDRSIPNRLVELSQKLRKLMRSIDPDVLVYEQVPVSAHGGGRSQVSHASLLYALGVILSTPGPDKYVGIMPITWKKHVLPTYVKGDEEDAVEMGRIAIYLAQEVVREQQARAYKKGRVK